MILIIGGVLCYDAFMQCEFTLHAYIIAWTGDIPALSKVMNITGHNLYSGYRFCNIRGIYSQKYRHVYFPTNLKERYIKKNHSTWLTHKNKIETATTTKEKENKKSVPLEFGRPPRCIFKHHAGYKAEEWANWITLYSVPLLKYYMQNK